MGLCSQRLRISSKKHKNISGEKKVVLKVEQKYELIRSFEALKELYKYEFDEEENLFQLLTQVAENMFNYNLANEYSADYHIYEQHLLRQSFSEERNKSMTKLLLHKGSLL